MPILVKSDDVRTGRKAKVHHGRLRPAQESNGLTKNPEIQTFQNFWHFWARFRQIFQIYHKKTHLLENWVTRLIIHVHESEE